MLPNTDQKTTGILNTFNDRRRPRPFRCVPGLDFVQNGGVGFGMDNSNCFWTKKTKQNKTSYCGVAKPNTECLI